MRIPYYAPAESNSYTYVHLKKKNILTMQPVSWMETGLGRVHVVASVSCDHEDGNRPGEGTCSCISAM